MELWFGQNSFIEHKPVMMSHVPKQAIVKNIEAVNSNNQSSMVKW